MNGATPTALDPQADGLMVLAEDYRLQVVELLRGRHAANAKMLAYLEGRGGTITDFTTMHAAHEILTRDLADALMCLGAAIDCEGAA
jgi:hypothetical protein